MVRSLLARIIQIVVTLMLASTAVFVLIHFSGDPTQGFLPPGSSPELRESTRDRLGLNDPLPLQYLQFLERGLRFDFGDSWRDQQPALDAVLNRVPSTLALASLALALAISGGIIIGVITASPTRSPFVRVLRAFPIVGQAVPTFWMGAMLMLVFAVRLKWLPASGNATLSSIILPAVTLALHPMAIIARLQATSMLDVARSEYVRTAVGKGLGKRAVQLRHVAPNAVLPVLGYIGLQAGFLVGGAVVVESIFAWPGVGRLALQAATHHDLPVIHAFVATTAVAVILLNLVVDLIQQTIDPRLRATAAGGFGRG